MERIENWVEKGLMKVEKESEEYQSIENGFLKGMGFMGHATTIMALHKNDISFSLARQARWDSFKIFSKAMEIKCGGDANVRYAWYGGSLDDLLEIVSVGFNGCKNHDESHGVGIPLFSVHFSIDSAMCTVGDEHGLRHVLLCRVILGKVESVACGSKQSQPSSKQYDSGVDDILAPTKHIIWTAFMNSYIHPSYILSFKYNYRKDSVIYGALKPQSPYVLFPNLVARVSNHLKPPQMTTLLRSYRVYQERKISREVWINKVRLIVGDTLLHSVITKSNYNDTDNACLGDSFTKTCAVRVEKYSLREGLWKEIKFYYNECVTVNRCLFWTEKSVTLRETLFWVAMEVSDKVNNEMIISFNACNCVLSKIGLPPLVTGHAEVYKKLAVYRDSVAVIICFETRNMTQCLDLWVLYDKYEGVECWCRMHTIGMLWRLERPVGILKNEILVSTDKVIHSVSGTIAFSS